MSKLTSRKFWIAIASFLGSIGSSIAGLATGNEELALVGVVCMALSAAIYSASEAYVDAARESSVVTSISASTNAKGVVESILGNAKNEEV